MKSDRQLAVALKYDRATHRTPRLTARGWDASARRIIALARTKGVPVQSEPDLAQVLAQLDPGVEVPPELYEVVARVLAFIYRMNKES